MLVSGVFERGDVRNGRSAAREAVLFNDPVGEPVGKVVHEDLDFILRLVTGEAESLAGIEVGGSDERSAEEGEEEGVDGEEEEDCGN